MCSAQEAFGDAKVWTWVWDIEESQNYCVQWAVKSHSEEKHSASFIYLHWNIYLWCEAFIIDCQSLVPCDESGCLTLNSKYFLLWIISWLSHFQPMNVTWPLDPNYLFFSGKEIKPLNFLLRKKKNKNNKPNQTKKPSPA